MMGLRSHTPTPLQTSNSPIIHMTCMIWAYAVVTYVKTLPSPHPLTPQVPPQPP